MPGKARGKRGKEGESVRLPDHVYLDRIAKVLALIATREMEPPEQMSFLAAINLSIREISEMLGMNYDAVRKALERRKKSPGKRRPKRKETD